MSKYRKRKSIRLKLMTFTIIVEIVGLCLTMTLSIFIFRPMMETKTLSNCKLVMDGMYSYLETTFSNVSDYITTVLNDADLERAAINYAEEPDDLQRYHKLRLAIHRVANSSNNVRGIMLRTPNGEWINSVTGICDEDIKLVDSDWYENSLQYAYSDRVSDIYYVTQPSTGLLLLSSAIYTNYYPQQYEYKMIVLYNIATTFNRIENLSSLSFDGYEIANGYDEVIYPLDKPKSYSEQIDLGILEKNYVTDDGHYFVEKSDYSEWKIVSYISNASLGKSYQDFLIYLLMMFIFFVVLTIAFFTPYIKCIVQPIKKLSETMELVSEGNWNVHCEISSDDEIEKLSDTFNNMIDSMNHCLQVIMDKNDKEQRMRYNLWKSQIDPHFIYNTMSVINLLARRSNNDEIVVLNTALISILKDRLRINEGDVFDTVQQEISTLKSYICIMNYRFVSDDLIVNWNVPEELLNERLPKCMMQTFIENVYKHAFPDISYPKILDISIRKESEKLIIYIEDNGIGVSEETLEALNNLKAQKMNERGLHFGIANVKFFLSYLYGSDYLLKFEQIESRGLRVIIELGKEKVPGGNKM